MNARPVTFQQKHDLVERLAQQVRDENMRWGQARHELLAAGLAWDTEAFWHAVEAVRIRDDVRDDHANAERWAGPIPSGEVHRTAEYLIDEQDLILLDSARRLSAARVQEATA